MISGSTWDLSFASSRSLRLVIDVPFLTFAVTDNLCNVINLINVQSPPSFARGSVAT